MIPARTDSAKTKKGVETRRRILETALDLFRERGYEGTSMRAVAREAGVAVGNAYYYFESKEHLVQAFYGRTHEQHLAACEPILTAEQDLKARLSRVLIAKIETAEPYHRFAGLLFKTAADPKSPLNPFSPESEAVRAQSTALLARVLEGAKVKLPADLKAELPNLLWLYMMAVILFWIHDESPGRARTRKLIERTTDLVTRLISLASFPLMGPVRKATLRLLDDLRSDILPQPQA